MTRRSAVLLLAAAIVLPLGASSTIDTPGAVALARVPHGGIQPEAVVDARGVLHLLYSSGEPRAGNLFYVRSTDDGSTFSAPVRVNSQEGSAIATGTIRGGQIAVGRGGRVHVAWNGSDAAMPRGLMNPASGQPSAPFLYTRSNDEGTAFEPQRNLARRSYGIDGGGSIAADGSGAVYTAWHGLAAGGANGEDHRIVWISRSSDDGATFGEETQAWSEPTGVCSCCQLRLFVAPSSAMYLLYRSATAVTHRDIYMLESNDSGRSFRGSQVQPWNIGACPMSSMSFAASGAGIFGAWETAGQVSFGAIDAGAARIPRPVAAPGEGGARKHPRLATNAKGDVLLVWTEGTAWARGGSLAWQVFDGDGTAIGAPGTAPGIGVWSFPAAIARPDGRFVVFY
ncbi:MAG: hypothetical protein DMF93_09480 [Acidobacteria bacterium]|nr:MAG: hypothetical protein DMF93_09480 [Acidobacteriota bacterium]